MSFESSRYSIPATRVTAGMTVELRVGPDRVAIHATGHEPALLAEHRRARGRGEDQIDPAHWHGLPDGSTRRTSTASDGPAGAPAAGGDRADPTAGSVLRERTGLAIPVARRDPRVYDQAAGLSAGVGGAA